MTCKRLKKFANMYITSYLKIKTPQQLASYIIHSPRLSLPNTNKYAMAFLHNKFKMAIEASQKLNSQLTLASFKSTESAERLVIGLLQGNLIVVFGSKPTGHIIASHADIVPVNERVLHGLFFLTRHLVCKLQLNNSIAMRILTLVVDAVMPTS